MSGCGDTSVEEEGFKEAVLTLDTSLAATLYTTRINHSVTINNTGEKEATLIAFDFTDPNGYLLYEGGSYPGTSGTCGVSLAAKESCTIVFDFQPIVAGDFLVNAEVSYFTGAQTKTIQLEIPLKGNTEAQLEFEYAPSYSFGTHNAGIASNAIQVYVTNSGETEATLMSGAIGFPFDYFGTSTYPGAFGNCGTNLEPEENCVIQIFFDSPVTPLGNFIENATITYNNGLVTTNDSLQLEGFNQSYVTITSPLTGTYINSSNTNTFNLTGTCSLPSTAVTIDVNGSAFATTCLGDSTFTTTLNLGSIAEGAVTVTVSHSTATPDVINLTKDSINPTPAPTSIGWIQTSPYNSLNVTPTWTPSTDPDVVTQLIRFHSNSSCSAPIGVETTLSPGTTSSPFSASADGNYYYQIIATDDAGNTTSSLCSSLMTIDTTAPISPSALVWIESSPQRTLPVTASWAGSTSTDVVTQTVRYFTDSACSVSSGTVNSLGGAATSDSYTPATSATYYFNVSAADAAGNSTTSSCVPSGMVVDIDPPLAPTGIAWNLTTPTNNTALQSQWVLSTSSDVATQSVSYFSDASCSTLVGSSISLAITDTSYAFTGSNGISYYYHVTVADSAGNSANSACSTVLTVDTTAPAVATSLGFVESSPLNNLSFNASWTVSTDIELASQNVQLYDDNTCTNPSGAVVSLGPAVNTYNFTGVDATTYSYTVESVDAAGNTAMSSCSSAILIDVSAPAAALSLNWLEGTYHNATSVSASWTPSTATDKASQSITIYDDNLCTNVVSGPTTTATTTTSSFAFTGVNGTTYYYQITTVDNASNTTVSACSNPITIDTVAPAAVTIGAWTEATPTASTTVEANWTLSIATDIDYQEVTLYTDSACSVSSQGPITKTNAQTSHTFTPATDGSYYFNVRVVDLAGNATSATPCSSVILRDTTDPVAATGLGYVQTSPYAGTSIDASWTPSVDANLASQEITFYTDPTCSTASGGTNTIGAAVNTYSFAGTNGSTYYYQVNSIDHVGNNTLSACSPAMRLDTTPPNNATALGWVESTPVSSLNVNSSWTVSTSGDVASQLITYFTDSACTIAEGTSQSLATAANTHNFTGVDGNSYYYNIRTIDTAGNFSVSGCSSVVALDVSAPSAPTALVWVETDPHNTTSINASWTLSASGDVATQQVSFYEDNACLSPTAGSPISLSNAVTNQSLTGSDGSFYHFDITVIDTAGNSTRSSCSSALNVDTTAPVAASSLGWVEGNGSNNPSVNASWTRSTSSDLASQIVTYYTDPACSIAEGTANTVTNIVTNDAFTGVDGTVYYYTITSRDTADNDTVSACSSAMRIDTTPPSAANSLSWDQTTPYNATAVTNSWVASADGDVSTQLITYYLDSGCTVAEGTSASLSPGVGSHSFTGTNANTYYFNITTRDIANNPSVSSCSAGLAIDTTAPNTATALNWTQTSPYAGNTIDANWTLSTSTDIANYEVAFFTDNTCSTSAGAPVTVANNVVTQSFLGSDATTYYFNVTAIDNANNRTTSTCSTGLLIDTTSPGAASALGWVESTPYNSTNVTASWTLSPATDISSQTITTYTDASCSGAVNSTAPLSNSAVSYNFSGTNGSDYYYTITTTDNAGNNTVSSCSSVMSIDTTSPAAPTVIAWLETSPHNSVSVTSSWTISASADIASQRITYFTDSLCLVASGLPQVLGPSVNNNVFSGSDGNNYYFTVAAIDNAGNETSSACSGQMTIDTTAPNNATLMAWTEGTASNVSPVNASWTVSNSSDKASQRIDVYQSATCGGAVVDTSALLAGDTTYSFAGAVSNNSYTYTITTTDTAGNSSTSSCSAAIFIDILPPADATALGWVETSPVSSNSVNASWTISTDADLASQEIQVYSDGICSATFGGSVTLGAAATTYGVSSVVNGNSYSYTITSYDSAGNSSTSSCSAVIVIDTLAPTGANTLAWTQTSPYSGLSVNATWTSSADGDEASERINIFENDSSCSGSTFATQSLAAGTGAYNFTSGSSGNTYTFNIATTDNAGNVQTSTCSAGLELDTSAPVNATGLAWVESTPSSNLTVTATWTVSAATDLASQSIQFYSDNVCTTTSGGAIALGSGVTTQSFTGSTGTTYSYRITSIDNAGNTNASACSNSMALDNTAPTAPVATNWAEGTITNGTTITATWTLGGSSDVASHRVEYFTDAACSSSAGAPVVKSATDTNDVFTGADATTYYYNVFAIDNAGNVSNSGCNSTGILIDTTAPTAASTLAWAQASPFSGTSIDATWTASSSGDVASQSLRYYADSTCTTADGAAIPLAAGVNTHNRSATDGATYAYIVTTTDNAGNSTASACSSDISVDTSAPLAATALAWVQTSPANTTSLNTTWTPSASSDIASQTITYYSDACTTSVSSSTLGAAASTNNFNGGVNGGTYYYRITSTDTAGNSTNSSCSATSITIDTDFPAAANTIAWAQTSPVNSTSVTATWISGGAGDISSYRVEYFNDGTCSGSVASSNSEASGATSNNFTGTNTTTHSFRVVTIDTAGNETASVCSNSLLIDTDAPASASTLAWAQGTSTNLTSIDATWTPSSSGDLASQTVRIYQSNSCGGAAVQTSSGLANNINTLNFTGVITNNNYTYTVESIDNAGNSFVSSCSTSIYSDSAPPANATALGFTETSPFSGTSINATWTRSTDPDLASQVIQVYSDATCTTPFGAPVTINNVLSTHNITGVSDANYYSYTIESFDSGGNSDTTACSSSILIDTTAPNGVSVMAWAETSPHSGTSINANWTSSSDGDEASERINIYEDDAACSGAVFATANLAAGTGTYNFTGGANTRSYTYRIVSTDGAGNAHTSNCSPAINLDLTAPVAASSLGWVESTPSSNLTVNATWTLSSSSDVASQSIQFYTGATCGATSGGAIALGSGVTSQSFTGSNATTYSYRVTTTDNASNSTVSSCSTSMALDNAVPLAPVPTDFAEGTLTNTTSVTARWTLGGSSDIANHRVEYFTDSGCASSAGAPVTKLATDTDDVFTGANGNTYYYTVTAIDNAGNETTSACNSNGIAIDTTAPNDASSLAWTQTSPYNNTNIQASWAKSTSGDLADQQIQYFADASCSVSLGPASSIGTAPTTDSSVTGVHGTTYSYQITSIDNASNSITSACSSSLAVDTVGPTVVATASLNWVQTSPSNTTNVDSTWTASVSTDVASEAVRYYTDAACSVGMLGPFVVPAAAGTHNFTSGASGSTYYYTITSTDNAGNTTVSACSTNSMSFDTTFPAAATGIAWAEASPHNSTAINANWTLGGSGDVANHRVEFYNDGTCAGSILSSQLEGGAATSSSFTGSNANTYSYRVITIDTAGNESASTCSNAIAIDTDNPALATALAWSEGTASNTSPVNATWTVSASGDKASQDINIYQSASCGGAVVETSSLATNISTYSFASAVSNNSYTYTIVTTDTAGNTSTSACSAAIFIDILPPADATALGWVESSPISATSVNATWTISTDPDLASQSIQVYQDATCTATFGSATALSAAATTHGVTGAVNGNNYAYRITSFDSAGNSSESPCSSAILIDTSAPTGANTLAWTQASPYSGLSVNATWTSSADGDEASERINVYENDSSCSGAVFATASLAAGTGAYNFTSGSTDNTYYFAVQTTDDAGNAQTSSCSAGLTLDVTNPVSATGLAWVESSPSSNLTVTASWTPSAAVDLSSQSIQFYSDATCTATSGAPVALGSGTTSQSFTGVNATSYTFRVTSIDNAGNTSASTCSGTMALDTTAPTAPVATNWAEGTITNGTNITATWNLGGSGDVASHRVEYFTDSACTSSAGASVSKTSTDTSDIFTGANGITYYYTVAAIDNAGNESSSGCNSTGILIDTTTPANATILGWTQSTPYSGASIDSSWTLSTASDIASQSIRYYADTTCTTADGAAIALGAAVTTHNRAATDGSIYTYTITTVDNAGNANVSPCSNSIAIDSSDPLAANTLAWVQSSPANTTSLNTTWTPSTSPDIASQTVTYYSDACTTSVGSAVLAAGVNTHNFTGGTNGNTYYFNVDSVDTAGNNALSACSATSVTIDTDFPTAANTIAWAQTSPSNSTAVSASWVSGGSGDIANNRVEFYNDGTCSGSVASSNLEASGATSSNFTGTNTTTHSFRVVTIDTAGNETPSVCSNSILIDTDAPNAASGLAWAQGATSNTSPVDATWTVSTSSDKSTQDVFVYQGVSCGGAAVATQTLASNVNTYSFAGAVSNNSYTFKVRTYDLAGNVIETSCSPSIYIDITPPADATALAWVESSPYSGSPVTASWTPSVAADIASQTIQFYADTSCTTPFGSSANIASAVSNYSLAGVTNSNSYTYRITSIDTAGNSSQSPCSSSIAIDTVAPTGVSILSWVESSPNNGLSVNASWTSSADGDEASETIRIYQDDATCSGGAFATSTLAAGTGAYNFTSGSDTRSYSFTITTADAAGNSHTSSCSSQILLDTSAPVAANTLGWSETSPSNSLTVTASWTLGGSSDVASQSIQFYADGTCTSADGAAIVLGPGVTTRSFTGITGTTYTYRVATIDNAGNSTPSVCSSSMLLDTNAPLAPVATNWAQGTLHNATTITSQWTLGGSGDVASHRVEYFTDGACSSSAGAPVSKLATDTDDNFTGANGNTYYYRVVAIDNAGNETASSCVASGITIDTTAPSNATALGWTQSTPYSGATVDSDWTQSVSGDLASQSLQYYADGTCTVADGAAITIAAGTSTHNRAVTNGSTYSYRVTSIDNAGNSDTSACSAAISIDTAAPGAANSLAWVESSPSSSTSLNTTWTASSSGDIASQTVEYYTDACTTLDTSVTLGAGVATHNFTSGTNGNTYYFRVVSTDLAGNQTASACSVTSVTIDTDFPTAANTIAWVESSPTNSTAITASWVSGGSGDLANHRVEYYNDGSCGTSIASTSLEASGATTANFTGTTATTHSFRVISIDSAGNETASACSNAITIDTDFPAAATGVAWVQGTSSNSSPVDATWTLSTAADRSNQRINIYSNGTCSTTVTETALLANNISTYSFTSAVSNNTYSYIIETSDSAGNWTSSACSTSMYIDTNPPANASSLAWVQSSPYSGTSVTASWVRSTDPDLSSQSVQFYSDGTCTVASGAPQPVGAAVQTLALSGVVNANTYSYTVTSTESAGNSATSGCSSAITIDTTAPTGANTLVWTEGATSKSLSVNATWSVSADGDEASERINIYEDDAACSGATFATSTLAAGTGAFNFTTGTNARRYSYTVTTTDGAGNAHTSGCSAQILLDTTAPTAASALGWVETSPENNLTVTATWSLGGSVDTASQSIQFHDNGTCSSVSGAPIILGSGVTTQSFTGVSGSTYSFIVTTTDVAGNTTASTCSSTMTLDTTAPTAPVATNWAQGTVHNATTVTSQWTLGGSVDVASHTVEYFTDGACSASAGTPVAKLATDTDDNFVGANGTTYFYRVTATDNAGNTATSSCVAAGITIDTTAPSNATNLAWTQSTPHNTLSIDADWDASVSGDLASQSIQYYADGTCTTADGAAVSLGAGVSTHNRAATNGSTYTYRITSTDNAGNSDTSACSSSITIDNAAPAAANTLAWVESSPTSSTSLNTTWVASSSGDIASQTVEYFTDACTTLATSSTLAAGVTTHNFTSGTDGNTYYFRVTSTDTAGNSTASACSVASITIDTTFPTAANTIAWVQTSPSNSTAVTASWVSGGSGDLANHRVEYFNDGVCGTSISSSNLEAAGATTSNFTGTSATTHSFRVVSIDSAGNETTSVCSNGITIDTDFPAAATAMAWVQGTSANSSPIDATWTLSTASDRDSQRINIYQNGTCSTAVVETALLANNITTYQFSGAVTNNTYSYIIETTDAAGNTTNSACSTSMYIDTNPPANASALGWVQSSPYSGSSVTASWTKSTDADLSNQTIQFYSDGTCTATFGAPQNVSAATETLALAGVSDTNTYAYTVTSTESSGNSATSGCSGPITIDTTAPTGASALAWSPASYSTSLTVTANWTDSADGDEASETIRIYENDATCSGAVFATNTLAANTGTYSFTTGTNGQLYSYTITTTDGAGNTELSGCSAQVLLDTTAPGAPSGLGWSQTSPHSGTALTASWTVSAATDVASQSIQFYDDATCSSTTGAAIVVGPAVTTQALTGSNGNEYTYIVTATDNAGNATASACSSSLEVDTGAPLAPSTLSWFEASPHDNLTVTAQWALSTSPDVVSQRIDYYQVAACGGGITSTENLAPGATTTTLTGASGNTYYFTVTAIDSANNSTTSACVASGMLIDIDPPIATTALGWTTTSPSTTANVTATWTLSASADRDSQDITYYVDATCTTPAGTTATLASGVNTHAFTGTSGNNYYYNVRVYDTAGNSTLSNCSSVMRIDNTAPTAATGLGWAETAPHDNILVTATWTPSASSDVLTQQINWYVDNACSAGSPDSQSAVLGAGVTSEAYTGVDGQTIYYTITSADSAGNATTTACVDSFSTGMLLDTTAPGVATMDGFGGSGWVEESPHNTVTIIPDWIPAGDADLASQTIQYWYNGTCSGGANETYTGLAPSATTHTGVVTVTEGGNYSYRIISYDAAENNATSACSGTMNVNSNDPAVATALSWSEGSVNNTTTITAQWTESGSPDTADQELIVYQGSGCTGTPTSYSGLGVGSTNYSQAITVAAGQNIFSFEVVTTDVADNTSTSACSADIEVDTIAPDAPTVTAWTETSPSNTNPINANWTLTADLDRVSVRLEVFDNALTCATPGSTAVVGGDFTLGTNVLTQAFGGTSGTTYYYRVTTEDNAGNTTVSASCSAGVRIDTIAPVAASGLNWTEAPGPTNAPTINANWTVNESTNISEQRITIYSDAGCSTVVTDDTSLAATDNTFAQSTALLDGLSVFFKIRTTDNAGNVSDSGCTSTALVVNTSPPGDVTGGTALNADWTTDASPATSPSFAWTNPTPLADWTTIEIGLGNTTASTEVDEVAWFDAGAVSTSLGITGLTTAVINKCQVYYPKVRARDNAGNTSVIPHVFTDGFRWDPDAPTFTGTITLSTDQTRQRSPQADWSAIAATDNCTFAGYRVGLGTGTSGAAMDDVSSFVTLSTATTAHRFTDTGQGGDFYLAMNTNYYINVIAFDAAGNETLVSSAPWQVTNTALAYPVEIANTGVLEVGTTLVQTLTCNIPNGVNRVLVVSVSKDSNNNATVTQVTAGSNNIPLTQIVGDEQLHSNGWRTRGEMWILDDDLTTGIPAIAEIPASTAITVNVTWTASSNDKIATCSVFEGVDQTTPVANSATFNAGYANLQNNINLTLNNAANSSSFVSCHHGNPTTLSINQGVNDANQQTAQGTMRNTINENLGAGSTTYNCSSPSTFRMVQMGANLNGD